MRFFRRSFFVGVSALFCATLLAASDEPPQREVKLKRTPPAAAMERSGEAVFSSTRFAIAATATPCSEIEPNENTSQATPMTIPQICSGSASAFDASSIVIDYGSFTDGIEDVFVLNLPSAAQPTIDLKYTSTSADLDLFLFTVSGSTIHIVDAATIDGLGVNEQITTDSQIAAGTYYIGVSAFSGSSPYTLEIQAPGFSNDCVPDPTSLCLADGRFRVTTDYRANNGSTGQGQGVLLTPDTGYFWFFGQTNVEAVVKILDACAPPFNRFWVFAGGLTNVEVKLKITDTMAGVTKEYTNPLGTLFVPIADTGAFDTCSGLPPTCTYTVTPTSQGFDSPGGNGAVSVNPSASSCSWTAASNASWIVITGGTAGTGNGTVNYSVAANSGAARTGTLTVAGQTVTINQSAPAASCTYTVSPTTQSAPAGGGSYTTNVTTQSGCAWTAGTSSSFISITSGASGSGNGSVSYNVAANSGAARSGTLTVAGRTVTVNQDGASSSCTYVVNLSNRSWSWCGGDQTYTVTKQDGCQYSTSANVPWITPVLITSSTGGTSSFGSLMVDANNTGVSRQGIVTIAGQQFTINQPARSGSGQYDGVWSGTTDGGRDVDACVANNSLEMLRVTMRLNFITFTCTTPLVRTSPLAINGSGYNGTIAAYPEISNIFTTVNGTFGSPTSMSATWTSFSDAYFIRCGSTIGFGTGGTTLSSGSFTATKQ